MLAVLALGGAFWIVSGLKTQTQTNRMAQSRGENGPVLQQAKQALVAWAAMQAATQDLNPGRLPCPEAAANIGTTNEGIASGTCTLPAVGRLPWRTLGMEKLRDANGEPLWYIVSTGWAIPNTLTPTLGINSNTTGNLSVDGVANAAVAMIIAPGVAMKVTPNANQIAAGCSARTQSRNVASPNYLDYLECQNVAGLSLRATMVDNATNPVMNDQAVVVSAGDVMAAVEPVVAMRIQRDVIPTLSAVYNSAPASCASTTGTLTNEWGVSFTCPAGSATNPVFPFAAPFSTTSATPCLPSDTDTSNQGTLSAGSAFKGAGCTRGLLPLSSLACNAMTGGPCDANFVQWDTATVALNPSSGTNWTSSCTASTASQARCDITFNKTCFSGSSGSTCAAVTPGSATLTAQAMNVGNALRSITSTGITNFGTPTLTAPLGATGAATATIQGTLPNSGTCSTTNSFFGIYFCTISSTVSVTVPISIFPDHSFLTAAGPTPAATGTTPAAWFWFLVNKWHHVTYYAVAPQHAPGGGGGCSGATCISVDVQGSSSLSGRRAVVALAGRSLKGTSGSSRAFSDFLDSANNRANDLTYEQRKPGRSFNDRFVSLSP